MRGRKKNFQKKNNVPRKKFTKKSGMEKAAISALLVQQKSFSLQRLTHDYNEITKQTVPIPGVSALPLDDDIYEWHGNVKAIANNPYKGAVLHFKLVFPKDYPLSPPTVYLLNDAYSKKIKGDIKDGKVVILCYRFYYNYRCSFSTLMKIS